MNVNSLLSTKKSVVDFAILYLCSLISEYLQIIPSFSLNAFKFEPKDKFVSVAY